MTIDKAIKEGEGYLAFLEGYEDEPFDKAVRLGIEALKRIKELRYEERKPPVWLLLGETEEEGQRK